MGKKEITESTQNNKDNNNKMPNEIEHYMRDEKNIEENINRMHCTWYICVTTFVTW